LVLLWSGVEQLGVVVVVVVEWSGVEQLGVVVEWSRTAWCCCC